MKNEKFDVIRYKYLTGIYNLNKMIQLVDERRITKEEFHFITTYSYETIKERVSENR